MDRGWKDAYWLINRPIGEVEFYLHHRLKTELLPRRAPFSCSARSDEHVIMARDGLSKVESAYISCHFFRRIC